MKSLLLYSLLFFLGLIIGWTISYLNLSSIDQSLEFYLGFSFSLALILIILIAKGLLVKLNKLQLLILSFVFLISPYLLNTFFDRKQEQLQLKKKILEDSEFDRKGLLVEEMTLWQINRVDEVFNSIKNESFLMEDSNFNDFIHELKNLSILLKPIKNYPLEQLDIAPLSPGRSYLITRILNLQLSDEQLKLLWNQLDLSQADLRNKDLSNKILIGINLRGSCLNHSKLNGSVLNNSNLTEVSMLDADLQKAQLQGVDLSNSTLNWIDFRRSNLENAKLNGCSLKSCLFQSSNLTNASFKWSDLSHSKLNDSQLKGVDFWTAILDSAEIVNSDLSFARFTDTRFRSTLIKNTNLQFTAAPINWLDKLEDWQIRGRDQLSAEYFIERDSSERFPIQTHFLKQRKN